MDALSITAASGWKARMESLEMLANNIANQSSSGFKADREFYTLYASPDALSSDNSNLTTSPLIERHWTDFTQGTLVPTGNPLDLALSGKGFFQVQSPAGVLYTRGGSLHLSAEGVLQTSEGFPVLDPAGKSIRLSRALTMEVTSVGEIRQGGVRTAELGLVEFTRPEDLSKHAGTYFRLSDGGREPQRATSTLVDQGRLESSNFTAPEGAVRLISVLRQFEMLQKTIQIGSEMSRRADEVARVGS